MNESVGSVSKVDLVLMGYTVTRAIYWKKWRCEEVMDSVVGLRNEEKIEVC